MKRKKYYSKTEIIAIILALLCSIIAIIIEITLIQKLKMRKAINFCKSETVIVKSRVKKLIKNKGRTNRIIAIELTNGDMIVIESDNGEFVKYPQISQKILRGVEENEKISYFINEKKTDYGHIYNIRIGNKKNEYLKKTDIVKAENLNIIFNVCSIIICFFGGLFMFYMTWFFISNCGEEFP